MQAKTCPEQNVVNIVRSLVPDHHDRLRRLVSSKEGFSLFCAVDNEIFINSSGPPMPLLVASTEEKEGRTSISVLLATLSAVFDPGRKVLLVEANCAEGQLADIFQLPDGYSGLTDFYSGAVDFSHCVQKTRLENLFVVPLGRPGEKGLKLRHREFAALLEEAKSGFELIIVDSAPAARYKDTISLGKLIGNILLVIRYGGPTREQVSSVVAEFSRADGNIFGAIINRRIYPLPRMLYSRV